jgi:CheY-like chemotaxis protein
MPPEAGKNSRKAPRILIVDDDASQRSLLDSFLTSQKFETVPVASGEKALEVLRTGQISMMISDVRMPGISGLETLRRARQAHALLPILLVTAYTDIREAVGAMRDGAVNYLGKPIDLDELLASVRQATGLSAAAPLKFNEDKQLPGHVVARSPLMQAVFGKPRLDHRRKRGGQGSGGGCHARVERARVRPAGQGELRGHSRNAAGERTLRPRTRGLHGRRGPADWAL